MKGEEMVDEKVRYSARLNSMANAALEKAKGDVTKARAELERAIKKDGKMKAGLLAEMIEAALAGASRHALTDLRAKVTEKARAVRGRFADMGLLDFPLFGGTPLRSATKAALLDSAERYRVSGTTQLEYAEWLTTLAKRLTGKQTVGEVYDEAAVEAAYQRAVGAVKKRLAS